MKTGTTPTHTFTIPFNKSAIADVEITYQQREKTILQKYLADCELYETDSNSCEIKLTLTQEETFLFAEPSFAAQIRVLDNNGVVTASDKIYDFCDQSFSRKVLVFE